jgi:hypothetical protein
VNFVDLYNGVYYAAHVLTSCIDIQGLFPLKITYVQAYAQDGLHTKIDLVINSYFWYEPS